MLLVAPSLGAGDSMLGWNKERRPPTSTVSSRTGPVDYRSLCNTLKQRVDETRTGGAWARTTKHCRLLFRVHYYCQPCQYQYCFLNALRWHLTKQRTRKTPRTTAQAKHLLSCFACAPDSHLHSLLCCSGSNSFIACRQNKCRDQSVTLVPHSLINSASLRDLESKAAEP